MPPQTVFGLVAWLEQTRLVLPLKGVECRFSVCGELLNVELDQIFHQNSAGPLDCLYTFPLPAGAAVYRCEMIVNGRVIRARVEEVEEARRLVREQKAAGHRTALVEVERENLFTLSLGNVQPGDLIIVRLAYFQTITRLADWTSFHIPFCPGVRYIPGTPLLRAPKGRGGVDDTDQVPDASRLTPPRIDRLHPDAAYLSVQGTVTNPNQRVRDLSSPSHPLAVRDGEGRLRVALADGGAVPDRDLVLRWTELPESELCATGWLSPEKDASYALLRLVAPADAAVKESTGQDIYFLVDRSGSMNGMKWSKAVQAFAEFVKTLGPRDRVWATFFEDKFRDFAEAPVPPEKVIADRGLRELEALGTGGGTELLPALLHVLTKVQEHSANRPAVLVLITDGQVGNEREILRRLEPHSKLRLHTFGIDSAVNDAFLKQLAAQQRGTCHLVTPNDDIVGTVARLGQRLRRPVLTALQLDAGWEAPAADLPDVHAGEVISLSLRTTTGAQAAKLRGRRPDGSEETLVFTLQPAAEPALRLLWARQRIVAHQATGQLDKAIALAKEANLVCDGTAFVAWDEAEKVAVSGPDREVYQPAMLGNMMMMDVCLSAPTRSFQPQPPVRNKLFKRIREAFNRERAALTAKPPPPETGLLHEPPPLTTGPLDAADDLSQESLPAGFEPLLRAIGDRCFRLNRGTEVPLEEARLLFQAWRAEMAKLPHGQRYHRLLDVLGEWLERNLDEAMETFERLRVLLAGLRRSSITDEGRVRELRHWVQRYVEHPLEFRARALEQLDLLSRLAAQT